MSLRLDHTPGEWDGTFAVVAGKLCEDMLLDGPFQISIDDEPARKLTGYERGHGELLFEDGSSASIYEITTIEVE